MILVSTFVGRSEPGINRSVVRRSPTLSSMSGAQKTLPCPATDFNAAGLLYFPSYSALTDRALFQAGEKHSGMVASRHVVYFGNVEPGEWANITFRNLSSGHDVMLRGADDRPLALMSVRFHRDD